MKPPRTPLTELEQAIAKKLCSARFPAGTASKRFALNLGDGYIKDLSWRGRKFMAYIAHRFRRQYTLTPDEQAWVNRWKDYEEPAEEGGKCPSSLRRLLEKEGER